MDYKEVEAESHYALWADAVAAIKRRGLPYGYRKAISRQLKKLPDGASCPREYAAFDKRPLLAAIAAAKAY